MSEFHNTHSFRLYLDDDEEVAIDKYLSGLNKFRKAEAIRNIVKMGFAQLQKEKGEGRSTKRRGGKTPSAPPAPASAPAQAPAPTAKNPDVARVAEVLAQPAPAKAEKTPFPVQAAPSQLVPSQAVIVEPAIPSDHEVVAATPHAVLEDGANAHLQSVPIEVEAASVQYPHEPPVGAVVTDVPTTTSVELGRSSSPEEPATGRGNENNKEGGLDANNPPTIKQYVDPLKRLQMGRQNK